MERMPWEPVALSLQQQAEFRKMMLAKAETLVLERYLQTVATPDFPAAHQRYQEAMEQCERLRTEYQQWVERSFTAPETFPPAPNGRKKPAEPVAEIEPAVAP